MTFVPYVPGFHPKGAKAATLFLMQCRVLAPVGKWREPDFQAWSPEQEYLCEWRTRNKGLSVYFGDSKNHEFVKSWGVSFSDMQEGTISTVEQLLKLVEWILEP